MPATVVILIARRDAFPFLHLLIFLVIHIVHAVWCIVNIWNALSAAAVAARFTTNTRDTHWLHRPTDKAQMWEEKILSLATTLISRKREIEHDMTYLLLLLLFICCCNCGCCRLFVGDNSFWLAVLDDVYVFVLWRRNDLLFWRWFCIDVDLLSW